MRPRDLSLKMSSPSCVATAAANCDIVTLKHLISQGEDINQRSTDGISPLAIAAFWGYADVVQILLENGANFNSQNKNTLWTPLHCAAFQGHGKVILKLTKFNPDFYAQDSKGRTPIDFASALDSIWPIFAAEGYKRTPKSELVRMDIIKKVVPKDPSLEYSNYNRLSSRPGSAYEMNTQSLTERQHTDSKMEYAFMNGDVLAAAPDPQVKQY
ncbi:serine/threonine-protein kinase TNNI3K-like [Gigantopelta aegis]|uniref:serine/threonine-protein kinase TNNI3K-like n=1 Tax=Gigantopelta aegis TaxID=1735272 RepID=UPI001B88DBFD|nr:serine/threonine-protein kinase TNNI3K-like [Gigantopelta aegis]